MAKIMIVDDDEGLRETLTIALERENHQVITKKDGQSALESLASETEHPELMILDVLMPRLSGLELIGRLRSRGHSYPVLFLSSRDQEVDRVMGLDLGGDDYITKPFSVRELVSRVSAQLRRSNPPWQENHILERPPLTMNMRKFQAQGPDTELELSPTEFRLLWHLAQEPGRVLGREQLHNHAYGAEVFVSSRTIDSHIKRLRKKLASGGISPDQIETVYGLGYRWKSTETA